MWNSLAQFALDSSLNQWIGETYWLWPVLEITHFIGLSLLFGGLLLVDLRMLGLFASIEQAKLYRLLPLVIIGFVLNLVTGILFFYGDPGRYSINIAFKIKMVLVLIAGINALAYHYAVQPRTSEAPHWQKLSAVVSLSAWTGVLLFGRLIPYIGTG